MVEARTSCWQCRRQECAIRCSECNYAPYCNEFCKIRDLHRHKQLECFHLLAKTTCAFCRKNLNMPNVPCTKCYSLIYCSTTCLQNHLPGHSNECLASRQAIVMNARKLEKSSSNQLPATVPFIGDTPAIDYLKLRQNEGLESRDLRLLFVGTSDVRSVVKTLVEVPEDFRGHVTFHIHENRAHLMARNLLFFYLAVTNPLPQYMTQIWYSTLYSEKCHQYVVFALTQLSASGSYERIVKEIQEIVDVSRECWIRCVPIWQKWLQFGQSCQSMSSVIDVQRARRLGSWALSPSMHERGCSMPTCHQFSWRLWFEDGLVVAPRSPERVLATRANCTLLCLNPCKKCNNCLYEELKSSDTSLQLAEMVNEEAELIYAVPSNNSVFAAWDYLQVKSIAGERKDLLDMYMNYVTAIFYTFCKSISKKMVKFDFFGCPPDAIGKNLKDRQLKMDRICLLDVEERLSTPRALYDLRPLLNTTNTHALLITHHKRWYLNNELERCGNAHAREPALLLALKDIDLRPYVLDGVEGRKSDAVRQYWTCSDDYLDVWPFVYRHLQAEILNYTSYGPEETRGLKRTLVVEEFARQVGFHLRHFFKEHYAVVPFRFQSNIRRVSMQKANLVTLEWKPIPVLSTVSEE